MPLSYRIVTVQVITALVAAAGLSWWSKPEAFGALAAGVACVVPNGYLAWRVTRERSASRLLGAGVAKFVGTIALMAAAFALVRPSPLGFFGTFVVLQIVHVAAGARMRTDRGADGR
jgi:ATP synthase protein I